MEIKIAAEEMYNVLVNAGIDANDAKAIIFDLLLAADGGGRKTQARQQPAAPPPAPRVPVTRARVVEPEPEPEPEFEAESAPPPPQQPTKIRKSTRLVNFAAFGGTSEPLGSS